MHKLQQKGEQLTAPRSKCAYSNESIGIVEYLYPSVTCDNMRLCVCFERFCYRIQEISIVTVTLLHEGVCGQVHCHRSCTAVFVPQSIVHRPSPAVTVLLSQIIRAGVMSQHVCGYSSAAANSWQQHSALPDKESCLCLLYFD